MVNFLKRIGSKPIIYDNKFLMRYWALLSESQVNYSGYIVVTIDTDNLEMSRKELIQVI